MNKHTANNISVAPHAFDAREAFPEVDLLLKDAEGAQMLGCSKSTFWRRVGDGTIPKPVKIGGMSRWPLSEIRALVEAAKAERYAA